MRRNIFVWALYDFANSIVMIAFLFYFSQWLVIDSHRPDWWYNATLVVSSGLFILVAPFLSRLLDVTSRKLYGLRRSTVVTILLYLATATVTLFMPDHVFLAVTLFTFGLMFYLISFVYYTPIINDLATQTNKGTISGIGMGANYLGQVLGLLAVLPFATGTLYLFGAPGRAQALMPAVLLFIIFAVPMLIWYKEPSPITTDNITTTRKYLTIFETLKQIFGIRSLALLIVGYFFFSDALLTFANNFPIYMEKVYSSSDAVKTYLSAGILIFSGFGSVIIGILGDKFGHKKTLLWMLGAWVIIFMAMSFTPPFATLVGITLVAGFIFGPMWGVSRTMVGNLSPREIEASSFGIYTVAERFATFIGPLTWSAMLIIPTTHETTKYSYAVFSMAVLIIFSMVLIWKMTERQNIRVL